MPSIKSFVNKFRAYLVPVIILNNNNRKIVVGSKLVRLPNTLVNIWDLIGYEVHGNPTEIIGPAGLLGRKTSGVGFLCDEQGVTVSVDRTAPKEPTDIPEIVLSPSEYFDYKFHAETVPFILMESNGHSWTWGGEIRKKNNVLTNGPGQPVYLIKSDPVEIVNVASGKTAMGYICDEAGVTVDLKRDFRVTYPEDLIDNPVKLAALKERNKRILEGVEVGCTIKFSGAIGKEATFDRIPEIFDVGQSKKNLWVGIVIGLAAMFVISRFV
jgi:hypothetical protein